MKGDYLKKLLKNAGYSPTEIAAKLEVTSQALNSTFNSPDVKSGILEKLCEVLGVGMSFFYPNLYTINNVNNNINKQEAHNISNGSGSITENTSDANKDEMINKLIQQNSELLKLVMENRK